MTKRALVTGGSRGIGAACARALAAAGMDVSVNCAANGEKAAQVAQEIGGQAFVADVSDMTAVQEMFRRMGDIDVLVCNAGIAMQKLFTDTEPEDWRRIFSINVDGVYNTCFCAVPHMIRNHWGRIIVISSIWGRIGASCEVAYSASKAALIGFTQALSKELGPSGITVNCVAPGVIDTDMNSILPDETLEELKASTALMRIGTPEDVANAVAFLASERASFITGQTLGVDGGFPC